MASNQSTPRYRFDASRMILMDVPKRDSDGQDIGHAERPPYIVLTSEDVVKERTELEKYVVEQRPEYSVWGGNDPPPVYVLLPDKATFNELIGEPPAQLEAVGLTTGAPELKSPELSSGPFDPAIFDSKIFDTGEPTPEGRVQRAALVQTQLRSASWTGIEQRVASSPEILREARILIRNLDGLVERCGLTNLEQQRAKALTGALVQLISSPQPEWQIVVAILNSPLFSALINLQTVAGWLVAFGLLILGK